MNSETLGALLDTTMSMLGAARADDWESVASLDEQRRRLLETGSRSKAATRSLDKSAVKALRDADSELVELAREARRTITENTRRVRAEHEAHRTYADVMESIVRG